MKEEEFHRQGEKKVMISTRAVLVFLLIAHCVVAFVVAPLTSNPASAHWTVGWVPWLIIVYWIWGIICTIVLFLYFYRGE